MNSGAMSSSGWEREGKERKLTGGCEARMKTVLRNNTLILNRFFVSSPSSPRSKSSPEVFYASLFGTPFQIRRSNDSGLTFEPAISPDPPCSGKVAVAPADPDEVFLACEELYRSTDGGLSWSPLDKTGLPVDVDRFTEVVVTDGPRRYLAATNAGVFEFAEALFFDGF